MANTNNNIDNHTSQRQKELESLITNPTFSDFIFSIVGTAVAIPLASKVPKTYNKYLPLLVLGALGGLTDYFRSSARIEGYQKELQQLQQTVTITNNSPSLLPRSSSLLPPPLK